MRSGMGLIELLIFVCINSNGSCIFLFDQKCIDCELDGSVRMLCLLAGLI